MKKSELLKKFLGKKYDNGGKGFTRPEGWEKTIKRSHFDSGKTFSGENYEDIARKKKEESGEEKKKTALKSISDFFNRKK